MQKRQALQYQVFAEYQEQAAAQKKSTDAQEVAAADRANAVHAGITKEMELLGKTNLERQISVNLAKAAFRLNLNWVRRLLRQQRSSQMQMLNG